MSQGYGDVEIEELDAGEYDVLVYNFGDYSNKAYTLNVYAMQEVTLSSPS